MNIGSTLFSMLAPTTPSESTEPSTDGQVSFASALLASDVELKAIPAKAVAVEVPPSIPAVDDVILVQRFEAVHHLSEGDHAPRNRAPDLEVVNAGDVQALRLWGAGDDRQE